MSLNLSNEYASSRIKVSPMELNNCVECARNDDSDLFLKLDVEDVIKSWEMLLNVAHDKLNLDSNKLSEMMVRPKIKDTLPVYQNSCMSDSSTSQTKDTLLTPKLEKSKRKTNSSLSINSTNNSYHSSNISKVSNISNQKHLKRRCQYKKRKNAAPSNPAQTMMEFQFPVWTFHVQ